MYVGAFSLPFSSTVVPPPSASATLCAVPCSCEPLIASLLSALTLPAATFVSVVPVLPASVTLSFVSLSYATAFGSDPPFFAIASSASPTLLYVVSPTLYVGALTVPSVSMPAPPPSAFVTPVSWLTFTASVFALPAATFDSVVPPTPASVTDL